MTAAPLTETLPLDQAVASTLTSLGVVRGALAEVRIGNADFHAYLAQLIREAKHSLIDDGTPQERPDPYDPEILRAYATALLNGIPTRTLISPEHLDFAQSTFDSTS